MSCASELAEAREMLRQQDEMLATITETPKQVGTVVGIDPSTSTVMVRTGSAIMRMAVSDKHLRTAVIGDIALLLDGAGITDILHDASNIGPIAVVKQVISRNAIEVSMGGASFIVAGSAAAGDRVQLDYTSTAIVSILPPPPPPITPHVASPITWSSVGGLANAKSAIEEAVLWPLIHGEILAAYAQRPVKGLLFYGPPGCGKTLLAKATASLIASESKGPSGFFSIRGPELYNSYVGETERTIRELFASARTHERTHGVRAVIFIDEADSCLGKRGENLMQDISVPAFLVEMDGMGEVESPLVILATNKPEALDDAVIREGRVDRRILIDHPTLEESWDIFAIHMAGRRTTPGIVDHVHGAFVASPAYAKRSGAMIAAVCDRATASAIRRDITSGQLSSITPDDCTIAITDLCYEHALS